MSNKRVSRLSGRDISGIEKRVVSVDPRFNKDLSDNAKDVDRAKYRANYGFLYEMRQEEIKELQRYVLFLSSYNGVI